MFRSLRTSLYKPPAPSYQTCGFACVFKHLRAGGRCRYAGCAAMGRKTAIPGMVQGFITLHGQAEHPL